MNGPESTLSSGSTPSAAPAGPAPVPPQHRIEILDVLRGFALFGVLLVNLEYFFAPSYAYMRHAAGWDSAADLTAARVVRCLAESKFYTLFSFLFGYGLALQRSRLAGGEVSFETIAVRRLTVLLLIGVLHGIVLWAGDILLTYAVLGFIVLAVRRWRDRWLLVLAVCGLLLPVLLVGGMAGMLDLARSMPETAAEIESSIAEYESSEQALAEQALVVYAGGEIGDILARRWHDWVRVLWMMVFIAPNVLAILLLGYCAGRRRLAAWATEQRPPLGRLAALALSIGLPGSVVYTALADGALFALPTWELSAAMAVNMVAAPALAAFYALALLGLLRSRWWERRLRWLAAAGRMALTNYLLQSVICSTLAAAYGLAWFGRVRPLAGVGLAAAIFAAQVVFSRWWLQRWRYGPAEWVWRSLTYRHRQPMRRPA